MNSLSLEDLDPSWLQDMPHSEVIAALVKDDPKSEFLKGYLTEELGLTLDAEGKIDNITMALMALTAPELLDLVRVMGAVLNRDKVAKTIEREPQLAIRQEIGESAYRFTLQVGSLLGALEWETEDDFTILGAQVFTRGLGSTPEIVRDSLRLKLPKNLVGSLRDGDGDKEWNFVLRVFKEYSKWLRLQK